MLLQGQGSPVTRSHLLAKVRGRMADLSEDVNAFRLSSQCLHKCISTWVSIAPAHRRTRCHTEPRDSDCIPRRISGTMILF
mgnify:CR=1 FL=1